MNNYTFKNILFVVPENHSTKSSTLRPSFSLLHGLKLSCCLSIFQGKHPQSYMSWLRVAVRFWVIGLFPFAPNYTVCQSIHVLKDIFYQKQYLYTVHPIHFCVVSDCMDLTFVFQLLFKVCSFASFAMSYGERLA